MKKAIFAQIKKRQKLTIFEVHEMRKVLALVLGDGLLTADFIDNLPVKTDSQGKNFIDMKVLHIKTAEGFSGDQKGNET